MNRRYILVTLFAVFSHFAWADAQSTLPNGIYPIDGISENLPTQDLEPLKKMIGSSRVVGLGESFHTSGGYLQAKYRLIKFMVEKLGFRGFVMETPLRDALATSQYIANCSGGIDQAMNGIFPVFAADSTKALFQFLCNFNRSHPRDPVRFFGFDIQEPYNNFPLIRSYLTKAAPMSAVPLLNGSENCIGATTDSATKFHNDPLVQAAYRGATPPSQTLHDQCQASLAGINQFLEDNKAELIKRSSESEHFYAQLAAGSLSSFENTLFYFNNNFSTALESRDAGMAGVVSELLRFELPKNRVIVWAQNSHLSMAGDKIVYPMQPGYAPKYMGWWLKQWLGNDYFPIGFVGYKVGINWSNTKPPPIPTDANSVEVLLHNLNHDYLLVAPQNSLLQPNVAYPMEQLQEVPFEQYRALLYFENSQGMVYWDQ